MIYRRDNNKTRHNRLSLTLTALAGAVMIICLALFVFSNRPHAADDPPVSSSTPPVEVSQNKLDYGEPSYKPNVYIDFLGNTLPVYANVNANTKSDGGYSIKDEIMSYSHNGTTAKLGVDVASFQEGADWDKLKKSGVDFAMIRVGYRGNTEGKLNLDNEFHEFMRSAKKAGIAIGIYFFSQAINVDEAKEEAEQVIEWLKRYKDDITYPVAYDWERAYGARTDSTDGKTITDCCITFCELIKEAGYTPMVYFNLDMGYLYYNLEAVSDYDFWLAEYDGVPTFYYDFDMLQFSGSGSLDGFDGPIDLNLCFINYPDNSR